MADPEGSGTALEDWHVLHPIPRRGNDALPLRRDERVPYPWKTSYPLGEVPVRVAGSRTRRQGTL